MTKEKKKKKKESSHCIMASKWLNSRKKLNYLTNKNLNNDVATYFSLKFTLETMLSLAVPISAMKSPGSATH